MADRAWKREIVPGKKKKSISQEGLLGFRKSMLIPPLQPAAFELQWEQKGAGEVEEELGREGLFRSSPLFIPDALSVPLLTQQPERSYSLKPC